MLFLFKGKVYFLDLFGLPFIRKKIEKILLKIKILFIIEFKNDKAKGPLLKDFIFLGNPYNCKLIMVVNL